MSTKVTQRDRENWRGLFLRQLKAMYTKYGNGLMVVVDTELDYFYRQESGAIYVFSGQPTPYLDGGAHADEPASLMDATQATNIVNGEGPDHEWAIAPTGHQWNAADKAMGKVYLEAIRHAFKLGPQREPLERIRKVPTKPGEQTITLGILAESDRPHGTPIVGVFYGDDAEPEGTWDLGWDGCSPPMCAECLEDGHDVELDGRCPHGRQAYSLRVGLI